MTWQLRQAAFYRVLDKRRETLGLSWRRVCREAAVNPHQIARLRSEQRVLSDVVFALTCWLERTCATRSTNIDTP